MARKDSSPKPVESVLGKINKRFGKGAIMRMDEDQHGEVRTFSSGSIGLDLALGVGGLPYGKVIEIFGPEASGKTTLALHAIREVQRAGGLAALIDAEHAADMNYARAIGVDTSKLLICQPDCGEQALEITEMLVHSDEVDLVVVDSVAALTPSAEIEGEVGDTHVGLQARMMSQALRKLAGVAYHNQTAVVFINQLRQKIGVTFGSNEVTTGGNALKYYSSVRIDIRRIATLKNTTDNRPYANRVRVKVVKNKTAPPFGQAEFDMVYGVGICNAGELLDHGVDHGVVDKSGAWYSWSGDRLGQGRDKARHKLLEDAALFAALKDAVMTAARPPQAAGKAAADVPKAA